jgi:hypothetical protein
VAGSPAAPGASSGLLSLSWLVALSALSLTSLSLWPGLAAPCFPFVLLLSTFLSPFCAAFLCDFLLFLLLLSVHYDFLLSRYYFPVRYDFLLSFATIFLFATIFFCLSLLFSVRYDFLLSFVTIFCLFYDFLSYFDCDLPLSFLFEFVFLRSPLFRAGFPSFGTRKLG